jgi:DnaK suppressor protein
MPLELISKKEGMLVKGKVKSQADQKKGQADQKKGQVDQKKETDKLDKKTIAKFRKILLKEREQIVGEVKQIVESSKEMGQDGTQDIGDEAANIYNKQVLLSLNENERTRLKEVDESLDRIENGTYGVCEECGDKIGTGRLKVMPLAKYCVSCQSKLEKEMTLLRKAEEDLNYRGLAYATGLDEEEA